MRQDTEMSWLLDLRDAACLSAGAQMSRPSFPNYSSQRMEQREKKPS